MSEIVKFLSNAFMSAPTVQTTGIRKTTSKYSSSNPFSSGNPFVTSQNQNPFATYGQNRPVLGGYFAGYYNNQPNIVGRRLFIEA